MKKKQKIFMVILLAMLVLLFMERLTGEIVHAVLGLALVILVAVHMYRLRETWKHRSMAVRVTDIVLLVLMVLLVLTGILAHPMRDVMAVKILHKLSAVLFVIGVIAHIVQHVRAKKK